MNKKFGDFHKLRLLNFDSGDARNNIVCHGENRKPGHDKTQNFKKNLKCSTNGFIGKCSKWMKAKSSSETSFREGSKHNRISYIFKRQSNQSKRPITKRSVSLYNLKQNFCSTSFSFTNPIRRSLKTVAEKSLKRKQDKRNHYNKTDVQVLFMSETRKKLIKPNIAEDKRKLDWINNSKSSDLFNYKSNQHHSNKKNQSHKYNNRLFKYFNHNNQKVCKFKQSKENNTYPVRIKDDNNYLTSKPCVNTMHTRYHLVNFSCAACKMETPYNECIHKVSTIDTSPCLNKQVWVTPPCRDTWKNCSGDSDDPKIVNSDFTQNANIYKIQEKEPCKKSFSKDEIRLQLCSPQFIKNPEYLAKLTLKYVLIVIGIIVWSPCILLMCIYWVVTYPSHPHNIIEKTNTPMSSMIGCYDGCGRNCCKSFLHLFAIFSDKVTSSYNTIFSLINKQKSQESQHLKPCLIKSFSNNNGIKTGQKLCPDPKNKYTLYYTRHRGWIMKPFKKRRRSINKRCECNIDEFRSEKSEKKVMHDQSCECFPEKLQDKTKSVISLFRQPSQKKHSKVSKVVSQKTSPVSNINLGLPPKARYTDATTVPDLVSNEDFHHDPDIQPGKERKPQKAVSFERKLSQPVDSSYPRNLQIMSPRSKDDTPFYPNTLRKEYLLREPFKKYIKARTPCQCKQIKRISSVINAKRPIPSKKIPIRSKCASTKIGGTVSCPKIKPKLSFRKYPITEKKIQKKTKVRCLCTSIRKNVNKVEREIWKSNYCNDMYIHTLRRTPYFWIYKRCPSFYPYFLIFYRFYENVVIGLLFIISTCIWLPILCCCYISFSLFCRCGNC